MDSFLDRKRPLLGHLFVCNTGWVYKSFISKVKMELKNFFIFFILSYLNTKPYQLKKKRETIQMSIYIYIKSYNFAGLPRDRALGRMLIL